MFAAHPFKNVAHRIHPWLFPVFYLHNAIHLRFKGNIHHIDISPSARAIMNTLKDSPKRTLILSNHLGFMDPPILVHLFKKSRYLKPAFVAGIDVMQGFQGWYLSLVGTLSLDRGALDRRAMQVTQHILDTHERPLFIFPEGEADYTRGSLRPFYAGACLFALNASKHGDTQIVPLVIDFQFQSPPVKAIQNAIQALKNALCQSTGKPLLLLNPDPWAQLQQVTDAGLAMLEAEYTLATDPALTLTQRCTRLRLHLLNTLCEIHKPDALDSIGSLDFMGIMSLKNQLRSLIAKKVDAPPLATVQTTLTKLQQLQTQPVTPRKLKPLEETWIGLGYSRYYQDDTVEKRLTRLRQHLESILPYSEIHATTNEATRAQWQQHINDTRRIKVLTLLEDDLARSDTSWEGLDGLLIKLEILLFSWFRHRGPKHITIDAADTLDVNAFTQVHANLGRKELLDTLTQACYDRVHSMMPK